MRMPHTLSYSLPALSRGAATKYAQELNSKCLRSEAAGWSNIRFAAGRCIQGEEGVARGGLPIRARIQKKMALNTTIKSMKITATSRKTMHRMVRLCF